MVGQKNIDFLQRPQDARPGAALRLPGPRIDGSRPRWIRFFTSAAACCGSREKPAKGIDGFCHRRLKLSRKSFGRQPAAEAQNFVAERKRSQTRIQPFIGRSRRRDFPDRSSGSPDRTSGFPNGNWMPEPDRIVASDLQPAPDAISHITARGLRIGRKNQDVGQACQTGRPPAIATAVFKVSAKS